MKTIIILIGTGVIFIGGILVLLAFIGVDDIFNSSSDQSNGAQGSAVGKLFVSTDRGELWNASNASFVIQDIYYYTEGGATGMLAQTNSGVYGSRDNGLRWTVAFGNALPQKPVFDLDVDFSTQQATIFVATLNANNTPAVFRSQDGGRNFKQVYVSSATEQNIVGVKIDPQNTSKVYVLLSNGLLFISRDKGSAWEQPVSVDASQDVQFTRLLTHPRNSTKLFATTKNALYRSLNAGISWQVVKAFTNTDIYSININVATQDIYLGTKDTIFYSQDQGISFTTVEFPLQQNQLPLVAVFSDPSSNALYVGSGNTLYKTIDKGKSWSVVSVFDEVNSNIHFFSVNPYDLNIQFVGLN